MLTVASLSRNQLQERLAGPGLDVCTGPFVSRIRSSIDAIVDGIFLLYGDYPLCPPDGFADFHVWMTRSGGVRRWYRPQVSFDIDGVLPFEPLPIAHAFPMLEWALNWCIATRVHAYLTVHAAVLERDGLALVMPAPPGSGKSTLCAALVSRGWRLLSDETAMFRLEDGLLTPVVRPISLKNRSIDVIRAFADAAVLSAPVENTTKGTVAYLKAPASSIARARETALPAWIVFPKYEAGASTSLIPIPRARAFLRMAENAFNYSQLGPSGFRTLADTIDRCDSYDFRYSNLDDAIALFASLERPRS
jgi:hypothetical protein